MPLYLTIDCKLCKGRGLTACPQGHITNCPVCDGTGVITVDFDTLTHWIEKDEDYREENNQ